jgi:hypothetical protein
MIRLNGHRFETIRRFVLVGVLAIGLAASTLLPALALMAKRTTVGLWCDAVLGEHPLFVQRIAPNAD